MTPVENHWVRFPAGINGGDGRDRGPPYQDEVSILRRAVLVGQFEDVPLLDELVGRVHNVLFAAQEFVDLQQLPHPLLKVTKPTVRTVAKVCAVIRPRKLFEKFSPSS